jgi:hypothetical protein
MTNTEAVRNHAIENYNSGAWDEIVECYTDKEIQEVLDYDGVKEGNHEKAIASMEIVQRMHDETRRSITSTIW